MARFNAAVMDGAADAKFQNRYNYLLDLLDQAYIVEKRIDGKSSRVEVSPQNGLLISYDGESLFSVSPTTGEVIIGKYDDAIIAAIATAETESKDDLAQQLGYDDYADMVAEATLGNTVISGGYINTDLIEAETIIFTQLAASAVASINDEIDLGGRNLLRGTELECWTVWIANGTITSTDGYPTKQTKITRTSGTTALGIQQLAAYRFMKLEANVEYNLSFELRGTVGLAIDYVYAMDAGTGNRRIGVSIAAVASETAWQKVSRTFTRTSASSVGHVLIGTTNTTVSNWFEVRNVKIEQGNKATAWTPNTDDQVSQLVTYAGVKIDATNGFVSTATIGGNTIQTKANATEGFAIYNGTDKVFGVSTDGYAYANRLYDPDDESAYAQIGAVSGEAGRSALTLYQTVSGYTTHRERIRFKSYGTTAFAIQGIVKPAGTDVEGTSILSVEHGDSYLFLADAFGMAYLKHGDLEIGVDDPQIYVSSNGGTTKFNVPFTDSGAGTSNATGGADTSVSFNKTFSSAPKVVANSINGSYTCRIKSVSTTGFVLVISGGSVTFNWIAILA